jgi:hypothetical protein
MGRWRIGLGFVTHVGSSWRNFEPTALLLDDVVYTTPRADNFLYGTSVHFNVFDPLFFSRRQWYDRPFGFMLATQTCRFLLALIPMAGNLTAIFPLEDLSFPALTDVSYVNLLAALAAFPALVIVLNVLSQLVCALHLTHLSGNV